MVQGPGENAGIIDVGDGWACAFKIESHNHPSYIEPYQGAATGVGGILRDIFTMGARPLAVMDSLRFGPIAEEADAEEHDGRAKLASPGTTPSSRAWSAASPATATASACPTWAAKPSSRPATAAIRWSTPSPSAWCARTKSSTPRPPAPATPSSTSAPRPAATASTAPPWPARSSAKAPRPSAPTCRSAIPSWKSCCWRPALKPCRPAPSSASRTWAPPASPAPPARWAPAAAWASTSNSTSCPSAKPA